MTARDDLVADLSRAAWPKDGRSTTWSDVADDLLAAGWSRPRVVTTLDELLRLPDRTTIIRTDTGQAWQREGDWWRSTDGLRYAADVAAPAPGGHRLVVWSPPVESGERPSLVDDLRAALGAFPDTYQPRVEVRHPAPVESGETQGGGR